MFQSKETTGKVWLVGAGPSDVGLLTVKGKEVLEHAEVVVYDALVGQSILLLIPEHAEKINVGKRSGHHIMPQEEINKLLLTKAQEGKRVVRLKGGDPFLFGRGGEELELLTEHEIPYEVVPGITSAISVPAYNGIPVTHRDYVSSLHIITGHKKKDQPYQLDFAAYVKLKGTLVFLMGVAALPDICKGLLDAGMEPDMPVAVLQQGTSANQKKIIGNLSTVEEEVKRQGVEPPAIIVVGRVVTLGRDFDWYERLPLSGRKYIVTRPRVRSGELADRLRRLGAEVLEIPAIRTEAISPNPALEEAMEKLEQYRYIAFTSPAGVDIFFEELKRQKKDVRSLFGCRIAALGAGTAAELEKHGLLADLQPAVYDAKHLGICIGEDCSDGDRILIPRARKGSLDIITEIEKRKQVQIVDLPVYDTVSEQNGILDLSGELKKRRISGVIFTSASTVKGFAGMPGLAEREVLKQVTAICIGSQTARAAEGYGMKTVIAKEATVEGLVEAVLR